MLTPMLKTALAAAVLALAPLAGLAQGCDHDRDKQAASCAAGAVWDADKAACVPIASS